MATLAPTFVLCVKNVHTNTQGRKDSHMTLDALRKYVISDTLTRLLTVFRNLIDQYFM